MRYQAIGAMLVAAVLLSIVPANGQIRKASLERVQITGGVVQQPEFVPPAKNRFKMAAIALIAGGGGLLAIGLAQDKGVEFDMGNDFSGRVRETGGSKDALMAIGGSMIGGGAALYMWGEHKKGRPQLRVGVNRLSVVVPF